jgi:hypothetical protein
MRRLAALAFLLAISCSKPPPENPFNYSFLTPLHLKPQQDKSYSSYKAFYLLTEDFEPRVESTSDLEGIREVLKFAAGLSSRYEIRWTHFVDVNALSPAFVSEDQQLKSGCRTMIADLKSMSSGGDDCELHLHGPLIPQLMDYVSANDKLHIKGSAVEDAQSYRQRQSFFFQSFYRSGFRQLVASLTYAKRLLEQAVYDGQKEVIAFRPGGWDHGSTSQDTLLYFEALGASGFVANSGLSTGHFGGPDWRVGNDPGRNLATVTVGEKQLFEVSPTAGPGGYVNPVSPSDLAKLAGSLRNEMPVIVAVYHLGALQGPGSDSGELQGERVALERHFKTVADLAAEKVLYPLTLRALIEIISQQQRTP